MTHCTVDTQLVQLTYVLPIPVHVPYNRAAVDLYTETEDAELAKVAEQTNAMMDNMALTESVAPETRDSFKITLLTKTAIAEIFTFWFQREGLTLTIEELQKKTITQMIAYCEKIGHKSGEMIVSENLKYEPVYKAVNRK